MATDINNITITGRLTRDPSSKILSTGIELSEFSIASNYYGGKENEEEVNFFDVVFFGKTAAVCNKYLTKGKQICITGQIRQQRWDDKETGKARSRVNIVGNNLKMLGSKNDSAASAKQEQPPQENQQAGMFTEPPKKTDMTPNQLDDGESDVPF